MSESSATPIDLNSLWVESKNADGRIYFYNAKTRQSTWTKPEGQRVMTQNELDEFLSEQNETSTNENDDKPDPPVVGPPPSNFNPYAFPPPAFGVPFTGIPPHLMPHMAQMMQNGFPGLTSMPPPPHLLRFLVPPLVNPSTNEKSFETIQNDLRKLRGQLKEFEEKLVKVNAEISMWSEFKNAEGRPYFYNTKTMESTWEKPLIFTDLIEVENQLEIVNKSIHENEKEFKRLEKEQSQNAAAIAATSTDKSTTPNPTATTSNFANNFTLEKLDQNDLRRFGDGTLTNERTLNNDQKSKGKARPISNKPIPGTPWCLVLTSDQQYFFFNPTSRTSLWNRPDELKGRMDVDEMIRSTLSEHVAKQKVDTPTLNEGEPEPKKVKIQDETNFHQEKILLQNLADPNRNERITTQDAESKAAKQRELVPYETRLKQFREMLAEKQVSAFATWEQELNKISSDPRYSLLTVKERKQEFDRFTHERADEERREKEAKIKQKKQDYRDLLKESNVHCRTTFTEFSTRHSKDERFRAIEKVRDRESWFHEYVGELKSREKEETNRPNDKEKVRRNYFQLLKEFNVTNDSSWSELKRLIDRDPRYKAIDSSSRRENWFREFQTIETNDDETERQKRIDASIKKRAEEVKEQLSDVQRELNKEREQVKKDKAMENFKALLTDMVRTADAEWDETKKILKKDPRWKQNLDRKEKELLFDEHVNILEKKRTAAFKILLDEHSTLTSTWKDVKKLIKNDPRYEKICANDRKRDFEREFENYLKEKYRKAKEEFRELLKETKLLTYKSLQTIRESEDENHLRDIEKILQKDQRYLLLDVIPDERSNILMDYLRDLEKQGVPPPPTAPLDRRKT